MVTESRELVVRQNNEVFVLPEISTLKTELEIVRKFQSAVKELLIEGHDYGVIPGTDKPTLLKPGAEKIDKILKLADTYEEVEKIEDWDKPLFYYKFKCRLNIIGTDIVVSEGWGSCSSMENKYRYRWLFYSQLPAEYQGDTKKAARDRLVTREIKTRKGMAKQYRLDNEDIYSLVNTILKMGKKRAHIDASLAAGRLSDVFTQDMEDIANLPEESTSEASTETAKDQASQEKVLVPGSDEWIVRKMAELNISEGGILEYLNKNLHVPVETTLSATLPKLTQEQRAEVAKAINQKEKQTKAK